MRIDWRILVLAVVAGVCIAAFTGFVENKPSGVIIPENKYYGFPMIWRISDVFAGEKFLYFEFFVNCAFWVAIAAILTLMVNAISSRLTSAS